MKNIIQISMCALVVLACDRLKKDDATKVQIQLPALTSQSVSAAGSTVAEPTGFTGLRPVNCYLVAVGGPEEIMSRNTCQRKDGTTMFTPRRVGLWQGAAPAGGAISLDVPSGLDRVVFVFGFYAPDINNCRDFKLYGFPNGTLSSPYLLGEVGRQEFKAGETVDLAVPLTFDTNNRFDNCTGPDFPDQNGGGGNTIPTKLVLNKDWFPYNATTENSCQSVGVRFEDDLGNQGSVASPVPVSVTMNSSPLPLYADMNACMNGGATSFSVNLPANTYNAQIAFKAPSISTSTLNLAATSSAFSNTASITLTNHATTDKGFEVAGPNRILPNVCYPYDVILRLFDGNQTSETVSVNMSYTSGTGLNFYSDANCSTAINPVVIPAYTSKFTVYGKTTATASATISSAITGYNPTTTKVETGGGTSNVVTIELRGDNMGPVVTQCYNKPYMAQLYNEEHTSVIAQAGGFALNFTNPGSDFDFYVNPGCSPSPSNTMTVPANLTAGPFYIKPKVAGSKPLSATGAGGASGTPYNINVRENWQWNLSASGGTYSNNFCLPFSASVMDSSLTVLSNIAAIPFSIQSSNAAVTVGIYSDASCGTPAASPATPPTGLAQINGLYVKLVNSSGMTAVVNLNVMGNNLPTYSSVGVTINP